MSKAAHVKNVPEVSQLCKSTFTLTFAIEILRIDVWHDCNEGWLDLGPCQQGLKLQYQLYPGQNFDIDILIWPHVAKIWCGNQYGYVRTWQFLERRWLAFTIRHVFPVRVVDLIDHVATITPTVGLTALGANAKNDKNVEAYLPPLKFMERRYFAPVLEKIEPFKAWIQNLIWKPIEDYIPPSYMDGLFDVPLNVTDIRHQDTLIHKVKNNILDRIKNESEEEIDDNEDVSKIKGKQDSKTLKDSKDKKKVVELVKVKYEIKLSGDAILAGTGRIMTFETVGERPQDLGEVIVLISSNNLPAQDDYPVIIVNIGNLFNVPINEFRKQRITQVYTKFKLGDREYISRKEQLNPKKGINFKDYRSIILPFEAAYNTVHAFLDNPFKIKLYGCRLPKVVNNLKLFGCEKYDFNIDKMYPFKFVNEESEVLIAVVEIDANELSKGFNALIRGEFVLHPPKVSIFNLKREALCTNDVNAIRSEVKPDIIIQPAVILQSNMMLEVSVGYVGCRPNKVTPGYSRLFCLISDSEIAMNLMQAITTLNKEELILTGKNNLLTGFALDAGKTAIIFIEGQKDGPILKIWENTADNYPVIKPLFSTADSYHSRVYPEMVTAAMPFTLLKMYAPLSVLLACPNIYARPALPLPARSALLKFGRLNARKMKTMPSTSEMPTYAELRSFRLELCTPPYPDCLALDRRLNIVLNVHPHDVLIKPENNK